jgi:hypothetical protein
VVYGARLESVWAKVRRGSNPLPSAKLKIDLWCKLWYNYGIEREKKGNMDVDEVKTKNEGNLK